MHYILAAKTNLIDSILCIPNVPNEITFNINTFSQFDRITSQRPQSKIFAYKWHLLDNNIWIKVFVAHKMTPQMRDSCVFWCIKMYKSTFYTHTKRFKHICNKILYCFDFYSLLAGTWCMIFYHIFSSTIQVCSFNSSCDSQQLLHLDEDIRISILTVWQLNSCPVKTDASQLITHIFPTLTVIDHFWTPPPPPLPLSVA